jgi:hypothetical protein
MSTIRSRGLTTEYRSGVVTKYNNIIQLELFHAAFGGLGHDETTMRAAFTLCVQQGRIYNTEFETYLIWLSNEEGTPYHTRTHKRTHASLLICHLVRVRAVTAHAAPRVQIEPSDRTGEPALPEDSVADSLMKLSDSSSVSTHAHPHT